MVLTYCKIHSLSVMKYHHISAIGIIICLILLFGGTAHAQTQKKKKSKSTEASSSTSETSKKNDIKSFTKGMVQSDGLFTLYRDTIKGTLYMAIDGAQLAKEYIYFSHVTDGVADAGFFRGSYRGSKIITFKKEYNRVLIIGENTKFYFDEENELSRSAGANINRPVLASLDVKAWDTNGTLLIDGSSIFLSEDFQMIKPPTRPGQNDAMLGKLSKDKSVIENLRNYPENTDLIVAYVYENSNPTKSGSEAVTDARNITIKYQHSIIEVPENDYKPRYDDARIGYFTTQVTDMTSFAAAPYRDLIHRWNLVKKNPEAPLSDPVEPIVYWIENSTPAAFRPIIKEAGERWNTAFEKAGFTNALVIKEQPDTADWDAGDIRYNVLRWTSSPQPPFGGYGPSFVNPRTGQILGADIMLEFSAVSRRLFRKDVFEKAGYLHDEFQKEGAIFGVGHEHCSMADLVNHSTVFGFSAMRIQNTDDAAQEQFVKETLGRLILHEIGHTLGLTHNMRASSMLSMNELKDKAVVTEKGLCSTVMEYPAVNYPSTPEALTKYFDDKPGPYDLWVIEYGYSPALPVSVDEEARLEKILSRSTEWQLAYGNDADDMRGSGKGIDPDINIYDLSSDPVAYGVERMTLVNDLISNILSKYGAEGETYEEFFQAYLALSGEYANQLTILTRQIGGVHINRARVGQEGNESAPFTPVSLKRQKAAMTALSTYGFGPNAFPAPVEVYNHLQRQRRGFSNPYSGEDPKIHERILTIQNLCLDQLLNATVLERITNSVVYGNEYSLDKYMTDLTDAMFKADANSKVNTMRQNIQIEYTSRLASLLKNENDYDHVSRSMALYELKRIDRMMQAASSLDTLTNAHRAHVRQIVKNTLES